MSRVVGMCEPQRLNDKFHYFLHKSSMKVHQVTLYSPDSLLYQHMLMYKTSSTQCCSPEPDDTSGWEVLSGEFYDGGSEGSAASSYFSDEADDDGRGGGGGDGGCSTQTRQSSTPDAHCMQKGNRPLVNVLAGESVEVGFQSPGRFSKRLDEVQLHAHASTSSNRNEKGAERSIEFVPSSPPLYPLCPRVSILQTDEIFEGPPSTNQSENSKSYVTPEIEDLEEDNFSSCSSSDAEISTHPRSNSLQEKSERGVPRTLRKHTQMSLDSTSSFNNASKDLDPQNLKRASSMVVRGDRIRSVRGVASSGLLSSVKYSPPSVTQSPGSQ